MGSAGVILKQESAKGSSVGAEDNRHFCTTVNDTKTVTDGLWKSVWVWNSSHLSTCIMCMDIRRDIGSFRQENAASVVEMRLSILFSVAHQDHPFIPLTLMQFTCDDKKR